MYGTRSVADPGGSLGSAEPLFCRSARMRRRPRARARVQSKTFWTAEPPFQNPRSTTAGCSVPLYTQRTYTM